MIRLQPNKYDIMVVKTRELIRYYKWELGQYKLNEDLTNFEKTWHGSRRLMVLDIIENLEGLLK